MPHAHKLMIIHVCVRVCAFACVCVRGLGCLATPDGLKLVCFLGHETFNAKTEKVKVESPRQVHMRWSPSMALSFLKVSENVQGQFSSLSPFSSLSCFCYCHNAWEGGVRWGWTLLVFCVGAKDAKHFAICTGRDGAIQWRTHIRRDI